MVICALCDAPSKVAQDYCHHHHCHHRHINCAWHLSYGCRAATAWPTYVDCRAARHTSPTLCPGPSCNTRRRWRTPCLDFDRGCRPVRRCRRRSTSRRCTGAGVAFAPPSADTCCRWRWSASDRGTCGPSAPVCTLHSHQSDNDNTRNSLTRRHLQISYDTGCLLNSASTSSWPCWRSRVSRRHLRSIWASTSRCAPAHATLDRRPSHCYACHFNGYQLPGDRTALPHLWLGTHCHLPY